MKKLLVLSAAVFLGLGSAAMAGGKPTSVPAHSVPDEAGPGMDAASVGLDCAAQALGR